MLLWLCCACLRCCFERVTYVLARCFKLKSFWKRFNSYDNMYQCCAQTYYSKIFCAKKQSERYVIIVIVVILVPIVVLLRQISHVWWHLTTIRRLLTLTCGGWGVLCGLDHQKFKFLTKKSADTLIFYPLRFKCDKKKYLFPLTTEKTWLRVVTVRPVQP